jgi:hypothetical protein
MKKSQGGKGTSYQLTSDQLPATSW